jgi:hypothetical protein
MKNSNITVAAIVIPLYKTRLSTLESLSLAQCFKVLSAYPIIAVKPKGLSLEDYKFTFDHVISFDDEYFNNIEGYNRLMLSPIFYKTFLNYQYILIHQPDAFVFRDELTYWCNQGYDYIGAPWLRSKPYKNLFKKIKHLGKQWIHTRYNITMKNTTLPTEIQRDNRVGNGGLSLRKTAVLYQVCAEKSELINYYNSRSEHQFNEDMFFGLEANRTKKQLKIPGYEKAVFFAMENQLEHAFSLTQGKLPFGCHAFDINLNFWRPKIQSLPGIDTAMLNESFIL